MNSKSLVLIGLLLGSGAAMAQTTVLPSIEVRGVPDSEAALSFTCGELRAPSPTEVESLLLIKDRTETQVMTKKLMLAVAEACDRGAPVIVLQRGKSGQSLTWSPAPGIKETVTNH